MICSPEVREFFSLDNPKNAENNDDDDHPGADESETQVIFLNDILYYNKLSPLRTLREHGRVTRALNSQAQVLT